MGCSFQPKPANPAADLKVTWHRMTTSAAQVVYQMVNGAEHSASPEYRGRVKLLTEELKVGWAKLQVSNWQGWGSCKTRQGHILVCSAGPPMMIY